MDPKIIFYEYTQQRPSPQIYLRNVSDLCDASHFDAALSSLPPQRQEKVLRMRRPEDRRLSLGAGMLLREALKARGLDYLLLREETGPHGKPFFPDLPDFVFSLSHSGNYAMCAAAPYACPGGSTGSSAAHEAAAVGCDVQKIVPADLAISARFFAPQEQTLLVNVPEGPGRDLLFSRLWSLKESYLKALGTGIAAELNSFSVAPLLSGPEASPFPLSRAEMPDPASLRQTPEASEIAAPPEGWLFGELPVLDGHVFSWCLADIR